MLVKIALPKGRLLEPTSAMLQKAGWGLDEYDKKARSYHLKSQKFPSTAVKVFNEKDIPIQVAVGNYDLGVCGLDWVEELLAKYPNSAIVKIKSLGYGAGTLFVAASQWGELTALAQIKASDRNIRIASEYPNLAEAFALRSRLGRFSVFPVWGGADVYPPENAELVLVPGTEAELKGCGMVPVSRFLSFGALLIANRTSWETKDLGPVVASLGDGVGGEVAPAEKCVLYSRLPEIDDDTLRLALPDGHQQPPTLELLSKAGIKIDDYPSPAGNRRPQVQLDGVVAKVIRPQDMPLQVANGNFDLAITGKDWLKEHVYQFPSSPVKEIVDLKFGWVRIVAVVSPKLGVDDASGLRRFCAGRAAPLRIASEYVNIADRYARDNRLGHYRVVPTWGATEAFLPDDADVLIENTQTGQTIARHNLKIIDTLFESTACLVGNTGLDFSSRRGKRARSVIDSLRRVVEG